jgi:hypothetical protein
MKLKLLSILVVAALLITGCGKEKKEQIVTSESKPADSVEAYGKPVKNSFLSAEHASMTHFDPSQSDVIPYAVPNGTFNIDLTTQPRVSAGPISIITMASTSPNYMWGASTQNVSYIDVSNGGFKEVANYDDPAGKKFPAGKLDKLLAKKFTSLADVENIAQKELGMNETNIFSNIYVLVDKDNVLYSVYQRTVRAYGLVDPAKPEAGIKLLRSVDLTSQMSAGERYFGCLLSITYDGKLIVLGPQSMRILDRENFKILSTVQFGKDEIITNSVAVDEKNGIYVASDKIMHKVVWTGKKLSTVAADGAWESPYDYGQQPPSVKFGKGTGSTPTLMGFGNDKDKLVVITDGSNHMKITAFWRDEIPSDAKPISGAKSPRIAGELAITCGLNPAPAFVQSEQSVVVKGYGAFVVNNVREAGAKDRLVDVLAGGPVLAPAKGVERVQWDVDTHSFKSVWTRNDVVSISTVPTMSGPSNIVFVNGYYDKTGWEVTGMDWNTGKTVFRTVFGQNNLGNGAYSIIQFMSNGDLLFNSVGGPTRVKLEKK